MAITRHALNRGTCVYLDGARVRFVWACGCTRVETIKAGRGRLARALPEAMVRKLAAHWRHAGVTLPQCRKHPDHYERVAPLARLNLENPQT